MKITDVAVYKVHYQSFMVRDSEYHSHPGPGHDAVEHMLEITLENGVKGCYMGPIYQDLVLSAVRPVLVGEDIFMRERIWQRLIHLQRLKTEFSDYVLCAIDLALYDALGKTLGIPIWQILGGYRTKVPCYGSIMVGDTLEGGLDSPQAYADYAQKLVAKGYHALKLHTWMPPAVPEASVKLDLEACRMVREAVGPDIPLMLDPYHYYSREEALELAKGLGELDFLWLEEPMDEHSIASYRFLTEASPVPICGPETAPGKYHSRADWISAGASHIGRTGALTSGGITSAMRCVHLYDSFGMTVELHGNSIGNLHILAAIRNGRYFERGLLHPYLDYEQPKPWLNSIYDPMDDDGCVFVPSSPGLGWDWNWEYIEDNKE
ncbi:MAG: enolase C-terminal domain-like protein [Sphaerochaetaceae bacterium]|jgi:L-alanine-DL-glutamate epimerase-like enolase superfamily enzyme